MPTVSHNGNPIIIYNRDKMHKNLNVHNFFEFRNIITISIVDNSCLLQQYKWNTIKIRLPQLIINVSYGSNFMTILDFFINCEKKKTGRCRGYFGSWGHALMTVAVVERFKRERRCKACPSEQKKRPL